MGWICGYRRPKPYRELMLNGYHIRYCPEAEVWQEAVPEWIAFFKQRMRWLTGNLETLFVYLAPIIDAPIPIHAKIDSIFYLFSLLFIGFVMLGYVVFHIKHWRVYNGHEGALHHWPHIHTGILPPHNNQV